MRDVARQLSDNSAGSTGTAERASNAADIAYAYVREAIVQGQFATGERLTEWQVADALNISRTPVREAMRRLVGDGILQFQPNRGTFVRSFTEREIKELFQLRVLLEPEVTAAAARRINPDQLDSLKQLQDQIEARGLGLDPSNITRIGLLNREFHRTIAIASDSPRLVRTLSNAIEAPVVQQTFRRYTAEQLQRSFHHHRELIAALGAGDASWARDVMSCHIRAARHVMAADPSRAVPGQATLVELL